MWHRFGRGPLSGMLGLGGGGLRRMGTAAAVKRPRIVVLGSGWGGFTFLNAIDRERYDVQVISPTNHFLFTPLLPSSVVGTLEFRAVEEPVRTVKNLGAYFQATCEKLIPEERQVVCKEVFGSETFQVKYDYLLVACGATSNTFNTPGIEERIGKEVFYLKTLRHARQIRNHILENFERAAIHLMEKEEREKLLSFVIVGGGPTSCEFVGELHDFLTQDVTRWFPELIDYIDVTIVEASPRLLGSFDESISNLVTTRFTKRGVQVITGVAVTEYDYKRGIIKLSNDKEISAGTVVWSAGLKQVPFIESLELEKTKPGRLIIDDYLMLPNRPEFDNRVFCIGDCAVNVDTPLAPLAQVASQQGAYLAKQFNNATVGCEGDFRQKMTQRFEYFSLGSMVTFGGFQGALDMTQIGKPANNHNMGRLHGVMSFFMWRSAYFLKQTSFRNMIMIPMFWFLSFVFGRDISRF